jgi:GTPase-associated protein 1, N-terminal domain type 1
MGAGRRIGYQRHSCARQAVKNVKLHQLLHGYKGGHGRMAGSLKLPDRDAETITRLSDLSGSLSSGVKLAPYLTVYPLPSQQLFAIARTWADHDAQRTGCVLTHTLLLPPETWGKLSHVRALDAVFQNPRINPDYDFNEPIDFRPPAEGRAPASTEPLERAAASSYVARYFGQGTRPIVWFNAKNPDEYLWRLLEHLWPHLRRVFSCCTFALQQRSLDDGPFDLLFAPSTVQSRFLKLSPEHLIESGAKGENVPPVEPWCQYWADALFSPHVGFPASESELPVWNELGEDPTSLRKLSLIQDLQTRAVQSPTAGVGAMDVVESLAFEPTAALPLKKVILSAAINSAVSAEQSGDGFISLRLIDDRLHRESFRNLAEDFKPQLALAATKLTIKNPEAAVEARASWLADSIAGTESPFVNGVLLGLREVASTAPLRLTMLRAHPEIAAEIFRVEPSFASTYLQVGGDSAPDVVAQWLSSTRNVEILRVARRTVLPLKEAITTDQLLIALLQNLGEDEVSDTLATLKRVTDDFSGAGVRRIVIDQVGGAYPTEVRRWASTLGDWSSGVTALVAATYSPGRQAFQELFEDQGFDPLQQADVIATLICEQTAGSAPYWLRELVSSDSRVISALLHGDPGSSETVDAALNKLLRDVPDLPLAGIITLFEDLMKFEGQPIFDKLFSAAMRSVLGAYLIDGDRGNYDGLAKTSYGERWFESAPPQTFSRLLVSARRSGAEAVARAWDWVANAPKSLYARHGVLPELSDELLRYSRHPFPQGADWFMTRILARSKHETPNDVRRELSSKMLRFAFDNVNFPLGGVVAEAFYDVYQVCLQDDSRSPSVFSVLFGSYGWDRAKDLRVAVIRAFLQSQWRPGDLALAADSAGILRKIFKRLHRGNGDAYINAMLQDLSQRKDARVAQVFGSLQALTYDPSFYEEWD